MHTHSGGVWSLTETQGMFYTGSGNYMINFTHPAGADQVRVEFVRSNSGQTYDGYNTPYTIDNFSITRLDTVGSAPVAVCAGCHQDTLDMTELKASSNLDAGVTFSGSDIKHNGVTWRPQANAAISLYNQAIKVVNSGGSSEGVLALPSLSLVEPNTTYIMECDILEVSPGITDLAFYAIDNTGAPYRVTSVQAGTGHRSIVFTTGSTLGTYLTFRASARPATAGLYFVIDNFVFRKYKAVDQQQYYGTDFSAAVMSGTDVYDNGRLFRPWTSLTTSLSVVGTVDKKIQVSAETVNNSRLRTDMPAIGGVPYLVKFTLGQAEPDKRAFIELLYRTGGGTWTNFSQGLFYYGSGDYQLNFTLPAGADELRVGFLRNNTGSSYDGLGVPYTIDNFSVTRITPQEQMIVTVCDPPPGGNTEGLYRYGFNGKENDNEVKGEGNQQDYGMRIYDPRLGKFLSVDPIARSYPELTPYQFASNTPISAIDLDGLEAQIFHFIHGKSEAKYVENASSLRAVEGFHYEVHHYVSYDNEKPIVKTNAPILVPNPSNVVVNNSTLGSLSERYESGGKGPGVVSSGEGDAGGVSYGVYQLASNRGRPAQFLKADGSPWKSEFGDFEQGSKEFSAVWKKIAKREPDKFRAAQHAYIKRTHYDIMRAKVLKSIGLNIDSRSEVLQDVLWSTAVQQGPGAKVFQNALKGKDFNKLSDAEIINLIYDERGRKDDDGIMVYFPSSSKQTQKDVSARYVRERKLALKRLNK